MFARIERSVLLCAVLLFLTPCVGAQTLENVFNDNIVQEVRLIIRAADWQNLRDNYELDIYYPAMFTWRYNGQDIGPSSSIEIKSRGTGSRSGIKPSLKVDMNRDDPNQTFMGVNTLLLRNNSQDATQGLHERLAMMLFSRLGIPAPREAHCRLYVSTDGGKTFNYFGLYTVVEAIDAHYLQVNIGDSGSGYLYKYSWVDPAFWFTYLGSNPSLYSGDNFRFEPENHKKDPDARPLEAMFRTINQAPDSTFVSDVSQYVDAREFMKQIAVENFVGDNDGTLGDFGVNNFYTYRFPGTNLHRFFTWDKSEAFDSPYYDIKHNTDKNVLSRRLLAVPEFQKIYLDTLARCVALAGGAGGWAEKEAAFEYNQTHADVLADPNRLCKDAGGMPARCSVQQYEDGYNVTRDFALNRADNVKKQLADSGYELRATNGATFIANDIAPGSLMTLWGAGLASSTSIPALPLPTEAAGVVVKVNGIAAPLLYVSPYQINLQVPFEVTAGPAAITATLNGAVTLNVQTTISAVSPGVFAVVHADYSYITPDNPARANETLVMFVNGLGPVDGTVVTGQPAPPALAPTKNTATATVGQFPATVIYAGLAPYLFGYQVNVQLPSGVFADDRTPLMLKIGGQVAPAVLISTR